LQTRHLPVAFIWVITGTHHEKRATLKVLHAFIVCFRLMVVLVPVSTEENTQRELKILKKMLPLERLTQHFSFRKVQQFLFSNIFISCPASKPTSSVMENVILATETRKRNKKKYYGIRLTTTFVKCNCSCRY